MKERNNKIERVSRTDNEYGEELKYAGLPEVIEWLDKEVENSTNRTLKPLLSLLKGFDLSEWKGNEIMIVHYGY